MVFSVGDDLGFMAFYFGEPSARPSVQSPCRRRWRCWSPVSPDPTPCVDAAENSLDQFEKQSRWLAFFGLPLTLVYQAATRMLRAWMRMFHIDIWGGCQYTRLRRTQQTKAIRVYLRG